MLGNRTGNRLVTDIQTNKFYSFHRPDPPLVALYCSSTDSQHNPRPRIAAGHSILTNQAIELFPSFLSLPSWTGRFLLLQPFQIPPHGQYPAVLVPK
jgi:hypothetical protein